MIYYIIMGWYSYAPEQIGGRKNGLFEMRQKDQGRAELLPSVPGGYGTVPCEKGCAYPAAQPPCGDGKQEIRKETADPVLRGSHGSLAEADKTAGGHCSAPAHFVGRDCVSAGYGSLPLVIVSRETINTSVFHVKHRKEMLWQK